jgi:hypothetical protein
MVNSKIFVSDSERHSFLDSAIYLPLRVLRIDISAISP